MSFSQVSDIIIINGVRLSLLSHPLESYLNSLYPPVKFDVEISACWRGYQATWTVYNNSLYLKNIQGHINGENICFFTLFRGSVIKGKYVKATWFTGILKVPVRPVIHVKLHIQKHSKELIFKIENGNIIEINSRGYDINEETFTNPPMVEYEISKEEVEHEVLCYKIMKEQQGNQDKIIFYIDDFDDLPF